MSNIFISENGFVQKINTVISNLTGSDGLIQSRTLSLSEQIDTTVERTNDLEDRINRQAEALRTEYETMLTVFLEAQAQFSMLSGYSGGTSYDSMIYY